MRSGWLSSPLWVRRLPSRGVVRGHQAFLQHVVEPRGHLFSLPIEYDLFITDGNHGELADLVAGMIAFLSRPSFLAQNHGGRDAVPQHYTVCRGQRRHPLRGPWGPRRNEDPRWGGVIGRQTPFHHD